MPRGFLGRLLGLYKPIRWHMKGRQVLSLNYPFTPRARWGHGQPPHPELYELIGRRRSEYAETLKGFLDYLEPLQAIAVDEPASPAEPRQALVIAAPFDSMSVVPEFRRRGVGSAMLRRVADDAFRRRMTSITLAVDAANQPALGLYQSTGYIEQRRRLAHFLT